MSEKGFHVAKCYFTRFGQYRFEKPLEFGPDASAGRKASGELGEEEYYVASNFAQKGNNHDF